MNKQKLVRFINKYYLNGTVNSVILNSNSNKLSARFISGDKTLLGELEMDKWQFEDSEVGIYNTEQLLKLLSVLDEDVNVSISKAGDKSIALKVTDAFSSVNYMLSDISIINKPPQLKEVPEFEVKIDVTPQFVNKFIAGKGALAETDNFTVLTDGSNTKLVIGYAAINTNRVTLPVTTSKSNDIDNVSFNANIFKEVLTANKECESATLEVSSEGLAKIVFKVDDFSVTYWLVAVTDVD
jgi:ribosome maturation factor RimP